jgi:uncharacterized membrane protein (UPF0127 family)
MVKIPTIENLLITGTRTFLGFVVFFVALLSIPIYNELKDNHFVQAYVNQKDAVIGETAIKVQIADSKKERQKGLSDRAYLQYNSGLLFIFDENDFHGIWMKDMNFAIDIIWLDAALQVIDYKKNVSPNTYPEVFKPKKKALYVLEVQAGFISSNYIKIGDQMTVL